MVEVMVVSKIHNMPLLVLIVKNSSKQQERCPNIVVICRASGMFCVRWKW